MNRWTWASLIMLCSLFGCASVDHAPPAACEVTGRLQEYQDAARTVHADRIAEFYSETGVLFEPGIRPIVGREKVREFIASFPGATVDVATATPESVRVFEDAAIVWGEYFERLSFPGQPRSEQRGKFVVEWVRGPRREWLIQHMYRIPIETSEPAPAEGHP